MSCKDVDIGLEVLKVFVLFFVSASLLLLLYTTVRNIVVKNNLPQVKNQIEQTLGDIHSIVLTFDFRNKIGYRGPSKICEDGFVYSYSCGKYTGPLINREGNLISCSEDKLNQELRQKYYNLLK